LAALVASVARDEHLASGIDEQAAVEDRHVRMPWLAIIRQFAKLRVDAHEVTACRIRAAFLKPPAGGRWTSRLTHSIVETGFY
jgi:hypothetical protein